MDAELKELRSRFRYTSDGAKVDRWCILKDAHGPLEGDCEDFALTLIWMMERKSMWRFWFAICTFKYRIWYVLSPRGAGHAVLKHRGKWVDNIQRRWVDDLKSKGYKLCFPWLPPLVALKMLIGWVKT